MYPFTAEKREEARDCLLELGRLYEGLQSVRTPPKNGTTPNLWHNLFMY
jgi:hypothetical protein